MDLSSGRMVSSLMQSGEWEGKVFLTAVTAGFLPEYLGDRFGSIFDHNAGECPYHLESFADHASRVIDDAIALSERFELQIRDRQVLVAAATWHDVGKMGTRAWKYRWVCKDCGRSHSCNGSRCQTDGCVGDLDGRFVVGYHDHAKLGVLVWNEFVRPVLGLPTGMGDHIGRLIEMHSNVHKCIMAGKEVSDPLAVLLSWADDTGRDFPSYIDVDRRMEIYPETYARSFLGRGSGENVVPAEAEFWGP